MNALVGALHELLGLFVEDGALALAVVAVVVLAALAATLVPGAPLLSGAILLFGCLGVLVANVLAAKRR